MATLYSMEAGVDGWVTLTLIPPVTRVKCIVWVLSLFSGSIDARTWRGYRLYGPLPPDGPHWQFQPDDGAGGENIRINDFTHPQICGKAAVSSCTWPTRGKREDRSRWLPRQLCTRTLCRTAETEQRTTWWVGKKSVTRDSPTTVSK